MREWRDIPQHYSEINYLSYSAFRQEEALCKPHSAQVSFEMALGVPRGAISGLKEVRESQRGLSGRTGPHKVWPIPGQRANFSLYMPILDLRSFASLKRSSLGLRLYLVYF